MSILCFHVLSFCLVINSVSIVLFFCLFSIFLWTFLSVPDSCSSSKVLCCHMTKTTEAESASTSLVRNNTAKPSRWPHGRQFSAKDPDTTTKNDLSNFEECDLRTSIYETHLNPWGGNCIFKRDICVFLISGGLSLCPFWGLEGKPIGAARGASKTSNCLFSCLVFWACAACRHQRYS